jgi:hypothetical protein
MPRRSQTETLVRLGTLLLMAAIALPLACSDEHSASPTPVAGMDGRFISVDGFGPGTRPMGDGSQRVPVAGRGISVDGAMITNHGDGSRFISIDGRSFIDGGGFISRDGARFDHDAGNEDAGN